MAYLYYILIHIHTHTYIHTYIYHKPVTTWCSDSKAVDKLAKYSGFFVPKKCTGERVCVAKREGCEGGGRRGREIKAREIWREKGRDRERQRGREEGGMSE